MDDINVIGMKSKAEILGENIQEVEIRTYAQYLKICKESAELYREYIENRGYTLTIDDICDTLDISANYVQRYIIKYLDRIELTRESRLGLKMMEELKIDKALLDKKILVCKDSFLNYLSNNLKKQSDQLVFTYSLDDFIGVDLTEKELKIKIGQLENKFHKELCKDINYEFDIESIKLQSIENMKIRLGFRHNVQIYRIIGKYSYKKYILNKYSVRYSLDHEDMKKVILDNKDSVLFTTADNLNVAAASRNEIVKESVISITIEKFALCKLMDIKNKTSDEIRNKFLDIIVQELALV